jgi:arginyl-tRNA synthetase
MLFESVLAGRIINLFPLLFGKEITESTLIFQPTRKEFDGDITLVVFSLGKITGKSPEVTGNLLAEELNKMEGLVESTNLIKGFLNIKIEKQLWLNELQKATTENDFGFKISEPDSKPVLVEYSSPNTNKPLHLGHIRNNLLGFSIGEILKANGKKVIKVNIVNDRGIHICKSMLAWQKFGNGETPELTGIKGDHLVGKYYVEFDRKYKEQVNDLKSKGASVEEAEQSASLMQDAREMLRKWEAHDPDVLALWNKMNGWVYDGFDITYNRLGVDFDKIYYESNTYLLGKDIVEEGLQKEVLYRKPDNSVWIDLTADGLDEKLLLRSDGTSVYITQDLGTAVVRYNEFGFEGLIYVVGNEQEYHFKVLFLILKKLGYSWADSLYHLAYNMVDLPSGKMKSREGTVVDADELIDDMVNEAKMLTAALGKVDDLDSPEALELYDTIGLGALKYFILKVDPDKRMLFNPEESIDFNGHTGPFIQYTHARLKSVLRKADTMNEMADYSHFKLNTYQSLIPKEKEIVKHLLKFPEIINEAGAKLSPAVIANYAYELSKAFNQFYHDHAIIDLEQTDVSHFRLNLCSMTASVISKAMKLLGIKVPEKM